MTFMAWTVPCLFTWCCAVLWQFDDSPLQVVLGLHRFKFRSIFSEKKIMFLFKVEVRVSRALLANRGSNPVFGQTKIMQDLRTPYAIAPDTDILVPFYNQGQNIMLFPSLARFSSPVGNERTVVQTLWFVY